MSTWTLNFSTGKKAIALRNIAPTTTIAKLKQILIDREDVQDATVVYAGSTLNKGHLTLEDYGLHDGCHLFCKFRLKGGAQAQVEGV